MSLINEALKKAQAQQNGQQEVIKMPRLSPAQQLHRPGVIPSIVAVLLTLAVAMMGWGVWNIFSNQTSILSPKSAIAFDAQPPTQEPDPESLNIIAKSVEEAEYYQPPEIPAKIEKPVVAPQPAVEQITQIPQLKKRARIRINPASYRLSGIFHGPEGPTAIINGEFLQKGDEVDNAKIIKIGQHAVELELEGTKFRIHL